MHNKKEVIHEHEDEDMVSEDSRVISNRLSNVNKNNRFSSIEKLPDMNIKAKTSIVEDFSPVKRSTISKVAKESVKPAKIELDEEEDEELSNEMR